ncbi:hypothetical protein ACFVP8_20600 [Viridibacillus arvi]
MALGNQFYFKNVIDRVIRIALGVDLSENEDSQHILAKVGGARSSNELVT